MPVEYILNKLHDSGYEAYVVGGCVRDSLLGDTPHDWDICTSALPGEIKDVFKDNRIIETGIKHGTVTILLSDSFHEEPVSYEITTYRIDGKYADNRHPDSVEFVSDLKKDLERRDFTINAMCYSYEDGLIDLFGGREDLNNGIINCVGDPVDRFNEDGLRIMRAIRFSFQFGFSFGSYTKLAIEDNLHLLSNISKERINSELTKIIDKAICQNIKVESIKIFIKALSVIVPDYQIKHDVFYLLNAFKKGYCDIPFGLAVFFDNPNIENILRELKFSNEIINKATTIHKYGYQILKDKDKWGASLGLTTTFYARKLYSTLKSSLAIKSIIYAKSLVSDDTNLQKQLSVLEMLVCRCWNNNDFYETKFLAVSGTDLIAMGYKGRQIGQILNGLLDLVMSEAVKNNRKELLAAIKTIDLDGE